MSQSFNNLCRILCLFSLVLSSEERIHAETSEIAQRISRIESGLLPAAIVKGEPLPTVTLAERMAEMKVPGLAIAVINNYKIEWAKGYGVIETGKPEPVDAETMFQACSISKPVAAMGALKLVEQGKLQLDAPVNQLLKSWQLPENDFTRQRPVTLRLLLSHMGGTTVHGFPGYSQSLPLPTTVEILNSIKPVNTGPVVVDLLPGSAWRYSGGGITIAQLMVADAAGKPFADYMREAVLEPIGMTRSTYEQPLPESLWANAARAHSAQGRLIDAGWHNYPEQAAAGLWTTPVDLAKFAIELMLARKGESNRVLSKETATLMTTGNGEGWGLGIVARGEGKAFRIAHGGSNAGYKCDLVAYPETGQGVAIMTSGDAGVIVFSELGRAVAREYGWADRQPIEIERVDIDGAILANYEGRYRIGGARSVYTISVEDSKLWIKSVGQPKDELLAMSATEFITRQGGTTVKFVNDESGKTMGLKFVPVLEREDQAPLARKF